MARPAVKALDRLLATRHPTAMLTLFCALLWLPGLFTLPPSDRDESRFVQGTRQMLETGDYVRIMNGTEARNRKPIGIYWLQLPFAAAARAAGIAIANPVWPYRLPSISGGLVAVLATFGLGQTVIGRRAALLSGAMLAACTILAVETHIAKTDAALLGATTIAMLLLGRAFLAPEAIGPGGAAAFWLAVGAGILLKGPITPMVAGLAALTLCLTERRAAWLRRLRPGWGIPLMLAVVLPWFVAIGVATHGRFFSEAVGGDLGGKLAGGDDAHGAPPGFHLLLLPLLAFPATIPLIRSFADAWRDRAAPATRFLIAWAVPSWMVMEAVPTKLPHYTLPLYPALFLLAARWMLEPARQATPRWLRFLAILGFVLAGVVVGFGSAALPPALGDTWWLGLPGLLAAGFLVLVFFRTADARGSVLAAPLLTWAILGITLPHTGALWISPRVTAALTAHWGGARPPDAAFGAVGDHEPSLMFLAGTDTQWLFDAGDGARFLAADPHNVVLIDQRDRAAFLAAAHARGVSPHGFATVSGFNYSRGRRMVLTLYDREGGTE